VRLILKDKNKKSECICCKLNEVKRADLKTIAHFLEYGEVEVIELLIAQYFKMQTIKYETADGYSSLEFIPFFETPESYEQFKKEYLEEHGYEYSATIMNRHNCKEVKV
jgi:hypothetical protein